MAYSANNNSQNQSDASSDVDGDSACTTTSSSGGLSNSARSTFAGIVRSHFTELAIIESTDDSASVKAANTALTSYLDLRPRYPPTTAEPRSQNHLDVFWDERLPDRPATPRPTAAGMYSTENRNRNRNWIQGFAQNADPVHSSQHMKPSGHHVGSGGAFLHEQIAGGPCDL